MTWPSRCAASMMMAIAVRAIAAAPTTQSVAVAKDGVAVSLATTQPTIAADAQPAFAVRFENVVNDYINLYDVNAYWNWRFEFTNVDPQSPQAGPWRLRLDAHPNGEPLAHRQIKPGEAMSVAMDLNDPPFTFAYVYAGDVDRTIVPRRFLPPGTYRVIGTIGLTQPFGPGYHEWTGPVTTEAIELTVAPASPQPEPTTQETAAFDAAIDRAVRPLDSHGLWLNGGSPEIDLPANAATEDVIAAAVNGTSLQSKAYRILRVRTLAQRTEVPGLSAALVRIGPSPDTASIKVVVFFWQGDRGWWARFYDVDLAPPTTLPAAGEH